MNYWLLPDTHFGHHKMFEYCNRPVGFEALILKNVARLVRDEDVLIHLGDFCIYKNEEWHSQFMAACAGRRWLIRGNHDRKSLGWYMAHGWHFVADAVTLQIFGRHLVFSHRPLVDHESFDLNIHGHYHNTGHRTDGLTTEKHVLLFLEHEYAPINLRSVVEKQQARHFKTT